MMQKASYCSGEDGGEQEECPVAVVISPRSEAKSGGQKNGILVCSSDEETTETEDGMSACGKDILSKDAVYNFAEDKETAGEVNALKLKKTATTAAGEIQVPIISSPKVKGLDNHDKPRPTDQRRATTDDKRTTPCPDDMSNASTATISSVPLLKPRELLLNCLSPPPAAAAAASTYGTDQERSSSNHHTQTATLKLDRVSQNVGELSEQHHSLKDVSPAVAKVAEMPPTADAVALFARQKQQRMGLIHIHKELFYKPKEVSKMPVPTKRQGRTKRISKRRFVKQKDHQTKAKATKTTATKKNVVVSEATTDSPQPKRKSLRLLNRKLQQQKQQRDQVPVEPESSKNPLSQTKIPVVHAANIQNSNATPSSPLAMVLKTKKNTDPTPANMAELSAKTIIANAMALVAKRTTRRSVPVGPDSVTRTNKETDLSAATTFLEIKTNAVALMRSFSGNHVTPKTATIQVEGDSAEKGKKVKPPNTTQKSTPAVSETARTSTAVLDTNEMGSVSGSKGIEKKGKPSGRRSVGRSFPVRIDAGAATRTRTGKGASVPVSKQVEENPKPSKRKPVARTSSNRSCVTVGPSTRLTRTLGKERAFLVSGKKYAPKPPTPSEKSIVCGSSCITPDNGLTAEAAATATSQTAFISAKMRDEDKTKAGRKSHRFKTCSLQSFSNCLLRDMSKMPMIERKATLVPPKENIGPKKIKPNAEEEIGLTAKAGVTSALQKWDSSSSEAVVSIDNPQNSSLPENNSPKIQRQTQPSLPSIGTNSRPRARAFSENDVLKKAPKTLILRHPEKLKKDTGGEIELTAEAGVASALQQQASSASGAFISMDNRQNSSLSKSNAPPLEPGHSPKIQREIQTSLPNTGTGSQPRDRAFPGEDVLKEQSKSPVSSQKIDAVVATQSREFNDQNNNHNPLTQDTSEVVAAMPTRELPTAFSLFLKAKQSGKRPGCVATAALAWGRTTPSQRKAWHQLAKQAAVAGHDEDKTNVLDIKYSTERNNDGVKVGKETSTDRPTKKARTGPPSGGSTSKHVVEKSRQPGSPDSTLPEVASSPVLIFVGTSPELHNCTPVDRANDEESKSTRLQNSTPVAQAQEPNSKECRIDTDGTVPPKSKGHKGAPPPFTLYLRECMPIAKEQHPGWKYRDIVGRLSYEWNFALTMKEKQVYADRARQLKRLHEQQQNAEYNDDQNFDAADGTCTTGMGHKKPARGQDTGIRRSSRLLSAERLNASRAPEEPQPGRRKRSSGKMLGEESYLRLGGSIRSRQFSKDATTHFSRGNTGLSPRRLNKPERGQHEHSDAASSPGQEYGRDRRGGNEKQASDDTIMCCEENPHSVSDGSRDTERMPALSNITAEAVTEGQPASTSTESEHITIHEATQPRPEPGTSRRSRNHNYESPSPTGVYCDPYLRPGSTNARSGINPLSLQTKDNANFLKQHS